MTEGMKKTKRKDTIKERKRRIRRRKTIVGCVKFGIYLLILYFVWMAVADVMEEVRYGNADKRASVLSKEDNIRQKNMVKEGQGPKEVFGLQGGDSDEDRYLLEESTNAASLSETDIQEARRIYADNRELLVLVNKEEECSLDYDASLRSICNGRLKASGYLYDALTDMLCEAGKAGYSFWIASAYRSRQWQQSLIDSDVKKFMKQGMSREEALVETLRETMPAGHSEHETGLALDILCSDNLNMDISQERSEGNIWLREHCHEYGFILRYPKEDEEITGVSYEPWHFRYVGKEAAAFMVKHNLTLEEFCEYQE